MDADECKKELDKIDLKKTILDIETFCKLLKQNKVAQSKELFTYLPHTVQCMFLHYSYVILSAPKEYSKDANRAAFYLVKLFRSPEMKNSKVYKKYTKLNTEELYKKALLAERGEPKERTKKQYEKEYQKKEEPSETDPLYIFYTSLYGEVPNSKLAVTWLVEHGVYDDEQRDEIITKYRKIVLK